MFTPHNDRMRRSVHGGITDNDPPRGSLRFEAICEQDLVWCTDEAGEWWATRRTWSKAGAPDNAQLANLHYARAEPPAGWRTTQPKKQGAVMTSDKNQPMYIIKLIERDSGNVVYDINTEQGIVTDKPEAAQPRTAIVSNIRRSLLLAMIGADFMVRVEPAPEALPAPDETYPTIEPMVPVVPVELSEARKRLCHGIFITALEGGIGYWSECISYRWARPDVAEDLSVDDAADINNFYADIVEFVVIDGKTGDCPKHTINLTVIDRGITRLASRECTCAGKPLEVGGHWHTLGLKLNAEGAEDVDFDAEDADAVVQAGLFNDIVYG